jgi:hypothetical protein
MTFRTADGFDEDAVLEKLKAEYGIDEAKAAAAKPKKGNKKRTADADADADAGADETPDKAKKSPKKPKLSETYTVEDNRQFGVAIKGMN